MKILFTRSRQVNFPIQRTLKGIRMPLCDSQLKSVISLVRLRKSPSSTRQQRNKFIFVTVQCSSHNDTLCDKLRANLDYYSCQFSFSFQRNIFISLFMHFDDDLQSCLCITPLLVIVSRSRLINPTSSLLHCTLQTRKILFFVRQCTQQESEITTSVAKKGKSFLCQGRMTFNAHKKYFLFLFCA